MNKLYRNCCPMMWFKIVYMFYKCSLGTDLNIIEFSFHRKWYDSTSTHTTHHRINKNRRMKESLFPTRENVNYLRHHNAEDIQIHYINHIYFHCISSDNLSKLVLSNKKTRIPHEMTFWITLWNYVYLQHICASAVWYFCSMTCVEHRYFCCRHLWYDGHAPVYIHVLLIFLVLRSPSESAHDSVGHVMKQIQHYSETCL